MEVLLGEAALFPHFDSAGLSNNSPIFNSVTITAIDHQ
jgi:hypothetical protein